LITVGQVIGTLQVTHRRQGSHGGPADETVRSGIGGTDYQIDLSDRGRIPASIVQRCQNSHGKMAPTAWRIADPNQSPGGQSTPRGREGRPRPHMHAEERDFGCMHGHALNGMHGLCLEAGL